MDRLRRKRRVACTSLAVLALILTAESKPVTWGKERKSLRWPDGKTINVYIEPDPNPPLDRSALIKEGMERWQAIMGPRGITIMVHVGAVPDPAPPNLVPVKYERVNTVQAGSEIPLNDDNLMCASCSARGNKLAGGEVLVRDDLQAVDDDDKNEIRNLGQHELSHVLGIGDDPDGRVTAHGQDTLPNTYNDTDMKEINFLYPLPAEEPAKADGETEPSSDPDDYSWNFNYTGPPDGHVALITLDVVPSLIDNITPPAGWAVLDPSDPARTDLSYPYYQGYMEDGAPTEPPWDPTLTPPLCFRSLAEVNTLSVTNPTLSIGLTTVGARRALIEVWAGGELQTLVGPVPKLVAGIPALPSWGLILLVVATAALGWHAIRARSVEVGA